MLNIFPSETLYSCLVRHCLTSAYPNLNRALSVEVGSISKQWTAQFPCFIPQLSEITGLEPKVLIQKHSVYPAYKPFLSDCVSQEVERLLVSGGLLNVETKMSLAANRVKRTGTLNYCSKCVIDDEHHYSWAYWHVEHQLPGSLVCMHHHCNLEAQKSNRKKLQLPQNHNFQSLEPNAKAIKLSRLSVELFYLEDIKFKSELIAKVYKHKLLELGLATHNKTLRVKMKLWRESLRDYWQEVIYNTQVDAILNQGDSMKFPSTLIYGQSHVFHPLKQLLVIGFLFDSINDFVEVYRKAEAGTLDISKGPNLVAKAAKKQQKSDDEIITRLQQDESLRSVSRGLGVSVGYVKKVAQLNNIPIARRTQFIFEKQRRAIWRKLFIGFSTLEIAEEMKTSVSAIEQVLSYHPELVHLRKKIRYFNKRQIHRENVLGACEILSNRNDIKLVESASYDWLYKNDKEWLYKNLPTEIPRNKRYVR